MYRECEQIEVEIHDRNFRSQYLITDLFSFILRLSSIGVEQEQYSKKEDLLYSN